MVVGGNLSSVSSSFNSDAVDLEMAAAQQRTGTDEGPRRIILSEITLVDVIEFSIERDVRAEDLDEDDIVHGHAGLGEHGLYAVKHDADLLLQVVGRLAGFGIDTNAPRDVQRVAHEHAVAEGRLHDLGQIDITPLGLRFSLFRRSLSGEARGRENEHCDQHNYLFHEVLRFSVTAACLIIFEK